MDKLEWEKCKLNFQVVDLDLSVGKLKFFHLFSVFAIT
jgi:hypothetical protein